MSIKARCAGCGAGFQAKDSLAGKRVKCPKCGQAITIGQQAASKGRSGKSAAKQASIAASGGHNPLLDLLDEVDVKSAVRGPVCPNCSNAMSQMAVVCVACGYNIETGKQLKTDVYRDDEETGVRDVGMTDAESIMAKAEKEIEALQGIIPICMYCKEIRDDKGYWNQIESYIETHSEAQFSHGICDGCLEKHYGKELAKQVKDASLKS